MGYSSRPCSGNSPETVMPSANYRRALNRSSTTSSSGLRSVGGSLRNALTRPEHVLLDLLPCLRALMLDPGHGFSSCSSLLMGALLAIHARPKRFTRNGSPAACLPQWHIEA